MRLESFDGQLHDAFKEFPNSTKLEKDNTGFTFITQLCLLSSTKLDKDNTGFVSIMELCHIITSMGEKLEPAKFDEWIREVNFGCDPFLLTPIQMGYVQIM